MDFPAWNELTARVEKLGGRTASEKGLWGKMNLGQMLVHCRLPLEVAMGLRESAPAHSFIMRHFVRPIIHIMPWPKGRSPTAPDYRTVELNLPVQAMADEIKTLAARMGVFSKAEFTPRPSPNLGPMTMLEWQRLMRRHLDYHLSQFGA